MQHQEAYNDVNCYSNTYSDTHSDTHLDKSYPHSQLQPELHVESPRYEVKITLNQNEIKEACKLRLFGHSICELNELDSCIRNTKKLIEQHKLMIHDGYDSFAEHLIVKDLRESKWIDTMQSQLITLSRN